MDKKYKVPIGPVHVGLKEPITAWLDLEGERIVGATVRPGAIHRGIEFMARDRNPIQVILPFRAHLRDLLLQPRHHFPSGGGGRSFHSRPSSGAVHPLPGA